MATRYDHIKAVDLLLSMKANIYDKETTLEMSPIYIASSYGHLGVVDLIFEKGGNIHDKNNDGLSPIEIASQNGKNRRSCFFVVKRGE